MKLPLLLTFALAAPLFAGTQVTRSQQDIQPAEQPALWSWFAGGSAGYLNDFEEEMYHLHIGADTPWSVADWSVALFGELGWTEKDSRSQAVGGSIGTDLQGLEIIPWTFNVKLERPLAERFSVYTGAGVGVAVVNYDLDLAFAPDVNEDDEALVAQVFAGMVYNVTHHLEIYGGARWIYVDYDAPSVVGTQAIEFGDDFLFELGARYNF